MKMFFAAAIAAMPRAVPLDLVVAVLIAVHRCEKSLGSVDHGSALAVLGDVRDLALAHVEPNDAVGAHLLAHVTVARQIREADAGVLVDEAVVGAAATVPRDARVAAARRLEDCDLPLSDLALGHSDVGEHASMRRVAVEHRHCIAVSERYRAATVVE